MHNKTEHILSLFEHQVSLHPEKTAVRSSGNGMTYAGLNAQANRWARYLIAHNLGGKPVGVSLGRSATVIEVILGILKAGSGYVFIDPRYPDERKKYIVEDAGISLLITSRNIAHPAFDPIVFIEDAPVDRYSGDHPGTSYDNENLAYIMYTSGSTGRPKGVELTAGNILCYIQAIRQVLGHVPEDIFMHTASFSFSSSVRQYFGPIVSGCTLVIADEDQTKSLHALLGLIKREKITFIDTTPSIWKYGLAQIDGLPQAEKTALIHTAIRGIVFSGDMLPAQLINKIRNTLVPVPSMFNVCGQTETIGGFAFAIPGDFIRESGTIPIGYPLPGYDFLALDDERKHVAPGEVGELYISSESVGNGYHNKPELTEQIFFQGSTFGLRSRVARIGDLIRYYNDRPVEIMGRRDFQIKIRAVRIDPNEIESVAAEIPFVKESTVVPFENKVGETAIAVFAVAFPGTVPNANTLRNHLKSKLPETYLPEKIIFIEKFPLNPNGKIDRKALQVIALKHTSDDAGNVPNAFKNEIEKSLYNLYSKILDIKDFSLDESFFDLGGHSLKAVELTDIMETLFNKKVPMDLVYRYSTVTKLAACIESLEQNDFTSNLINIKPEGNGIPFVCIHGDDANFFIPKYLGAETPFYGYFHQGRNGEKVRYSDIESIASTYTDELLKVRPRGPYILAGYSIGGVIAQAMIGFLHEQNQEVKLLVLFDTESPEYNGKRVKGRKVFHDIVQAGNPVVADTNTAKNGLIDRGFSYARFRWFNASYHIGAFLANAGFKVPLLLRNSYIMGVYRRARSRYKPHKTGVNTLLFRATRDNFEDYDLGWGRFITGETKIVEIDSDHDRIIKEPFIRQISEEMARDIISIPR